GLILRTSPPSRSIALRIAARATTHGTPVKSCKTTRAGRNGSSKSSPSAPASGCHFASCSTCEASVNSPPAFRRTFSSRIRTVNGNRSIESSTPSLTSFDSEYQETVVPPVVLIDERAPNGSRGLFVEVPIQETLSDRG